MLAATLAVRAGEPAFYALGIATGAVWVGGSRLAGPLPWLGDAQGGRATWRAIGAGVVVGVACFLGFFGARYVASAIPVLDHSVNGVLQRADSGSRLAVLVTALLSGVGEEVFFRGALYAVLPRRHRFWTCVGVYALVTVTTLHLVLVIAAAAMGIVFTLARRISGGLLVPIVVHLTWSTCMLLLLPR